MGGKQRSSRMVAEAWVQQKRRKNSAITPDTEKKKMGKGDRNHSGKDALQRHPRISQVGTRRNGDVQTGVVEKDLMTRGNNKRSDVEKKIHPKR